MNNFKLSLILAVFIFGIGFAKESKADAITEEILRTFKIPYDSYAKISVLASLQRIRKIDEGQEVSKAIALIELQLVTDLAYLDYIIKRDGKNADYSRYVMNKIVFGIREGFIEGGSNVHSEDLQVTGREDGSVNMKEIFEGVVIPEEQKLEFGKWYRKYSVPHQFKIPDKK